MRAVWQSLEPDPLLIQKREPSDTAKCRAARLYSRTTALIDIPAQF
jgi:hypothetical protein